MAIFLCVVAVGIISWKVNKNNTSGFKEGIVEKNGKQYGMKTWPNSQVTYIGTVSKIDYSKKLLELKGVNQENLNIDLNSVQRIYARPKIIFPGKNDAGLKTEWSINEIHKNDTIEIMADNLQNNIIKAVTIGIYRD